MTPPRNDHKKRRVINHFGLNVESNIHYTCDFPLIAHDGPLALAKPADFDISFDTGNIRRLISF
jgi:hypothetical protein